jgi:hypothetical protein
MPQRYSLANRLKSQVARALDTRLKSWDRSTNPMMVESSEFRVTLDIEADGDITLSVSPLLAGLRPIEIAFSGNQLSHIQYDNLMDFRLRCRRTHQYLQAKGKV